MFVGFPASWYIAIAIYVVAFVVSIWFGVSGYRMMNKYRDDDEVKM